MYSTAIDYLITSADVQAGCQHFSNWKRDPCIHIEHCKRWNAWCLCNYRMCLFFLSSDLWSYSNSSYLNELADNLVTSRNVICSMIIWLFKEILMKQEKNYIETNNLRQFFSFQALSQNKFVGLKQVQFLKTSKFIRRYMMIWIKISYHKLDNLIGLSFFAVWSFYFLVWTANGNLNLLNSSISRRQYNGGSFPGLKRFIYTPITIKACIIQCSDYSSLHLDIPTTFLFQQFRSNKFLLSSQLISLQED